MSAPANDGVFNPSFGVNAAQAEQPLPDSREQRKKRKSCQCLRWSSRRVRTTMRGGNCCNGMCLVVTAVIVFLLPSGFDPVLVDFATMTGEMMSSRYRELTA